MTEVATAFEDPPRRRLLRIGLPLAITCALLAVIVGRVGAGELLATLRAADPVALGVALVFSLVVHVPLPAEKWRRILAALGPRLSLGEACRVVLGCQPLRFLLPLKSGELFKVAYLRGAHGVPAATGTTSVVFDKASNIVVVIVVAAVGLSVAPLGGRATAVILALLLPAPLLLSRRLQAPLRRVAAVLPGRIGRFGVEALEALRALSPGAKIMALGFSVLTLTTETTIYFLAMYSLGVDVPFTTLFFGIPLVILIANIPVTMSGIGAREHGVMAIFAAHASAEELAAAGLIVSALGPILLALLGLPLVRGFIARAFPGQATMNPVTGSL